MKKKTTREHYEKYRDLAEQKGVGASISMYYLGKPKEKWIELFLEDEHLNNTPLSLYDGTYVSTGAGISLADNVCMHKHVIIYQIIGATPDFTS
jgi:hypothetical protein